MCQLPKGPVLEVVPVETLFVKCWDLLENSIYFSMEGYKLDGRTEELSSPPFLTFHKIKLSMAHEIMAITGHESIQEVERYTKSAEQKRLAESAIKKLEGQK